MTGRYLHNNGWFVVRSLVAEGVTKNAIEWVITPNVIPGWIADPVIHVSQIGYHPAQPKAVFVELDRSDKKIQNVSLYRIVPDGKQQLVMSQKPATGTPFLRYNYLKLDFTKVTEPGTYIIRYGTFQGLIYDSSLEHGLKTATHSWKKDDDWVFTENNPGRELTTAAHMAAASRALKGFNDTLSAQCLDLAEAIFHLDRQLQGRAVSSKIHAASELLLTTGKAEYREFIIQNEAALLKDIRSLGWLVARSLPLIDNEIITEKVRKEMAGLSADIVKQGAETPFGVPYRPNIWGAGWDIQSFGVRQYFLHKAFPDIFPADYIFNALNFILGVHPGSNTSSFASGVGSRSTTVAYGVNRADWSYIPGGVSSGTALIRPDFPELLDWPFLWQQQEYVMGGGATNFMFLVLAADHLLR